MFSIVIPLYNKELSIAATLNNVLNQTFTLFEIIVVNDGSTDNSEQIVANISDNRIRLINKENGGVCSARNRGIKEAKYKYIAFLDADDLWHETYLEEQSKLIRDFDKAAMWGINYYAVQNSKPVYFSTGLDKKFRGYVENYFGFKHVSDLFCSSSVVIDKKVFEKVGDFDTRIKYSEDLDMWYRIILNYPVVFDSNYLVSYIHDAENRALNKQVSLKTFLIFYVDKYKFYCQHDIIFSKFINTWTAAHLVKYYFNSKGDYENAKITANKIMYKNIHYKYFLWFKMPYFIGLFFYKLYCFKIKIKKNFK